MFMMVLVVWMHGQSPAITNITFYSEKACEEAAKKILKTHSADEAGIDIHTRYTCVKQS